MGRCMDGDMEDGLGPWRGERHSIIYGEIESIRACKKAAEEAWGRIPMLP